jgi:hypothetical protein
MTKRKPKQVSFEVSRSDHRKLSALADRAVSMAVAYNIEYDKQWALMDLTACHANGMPLDLEKLAGADDFNFAHDVFGIRRHLDRDTGTLQNCFVPRCHAQRLRVTA